MIYQKGIESQWHGIGVRVSSIHPLADGRWKTTIYILDQRMKSIAKKQVASLRGETFEGFSERVPGAIEQLIKENADLIMQHMIHNEPDFTLETYASLRWMDIAALAKWARQEERYRVLWEKKLCAVFGTVVLEECNEVMLEERMEEMTHRRRRKTAVSEEERMAWIVLDGVLECAVREGILAHNPARAQARKYRKELSTIASKDLARQSLTEAEQRALLEICLQRREETPIYNAVLLQYLCGMTVPELCGLSVGDWQKRDDVSWLEITRMYKQEHDGFACMTVLLDSQHAYHKIPCSRITASLLSYQVRQLKKQGLGKREDPFFVNAQGIRMTPEEYRIIVKQIQEEIIQGGARLPFVKRASRLSEKGRPSIFYGDLLRCTVEYNLRTACNFPDADVEALLGRYRLQTYATRYVDWTNTLLLSVQAERINRLWHSRVLALNGEEAGTMREGVLWEGDAEAGAEIQVQAKYGFYGVVKGRGVE